jgi:hypothetical protein
MALFDTVSPESKYYVPPSYNAHGGLLYKKTGEKTLFGKVSDIALPVLGGIGGSLLGIPQVGMMAGQGLVAGLNRLASNNARGDTKENIDQDLSKTMARGNLGAGLGTLGLGVIGSAGLFAGTKLGQFASNNAKGLLQIGAREVPAGIASVIGKTNPLDDDEEVITYKEGGSVKSEKAVIYADKDDTEDYDMVDKRTGKKFGEGRYGELILDQKAKIAIDTIMGSGLSKDGKQSMLGRKLFKELLTHKPSEGEIRKYKDGGPVDEPQSNRFIRVGKGIYVDKQPESKGLSGNVHRIYKLTTDGKWTKLGLSMGSPEGTIFMPVEYPNVNIEKGTYRTGSGYRDRKITFLPDSGGYGGKPIPSNEVIPEPQKKPFSMLNKSATTPTPSVTSSSTLPTVTTTPTIRRPTKSVVATKANTTATKPVDIASKFQTALADPSDVGYTIESPKPIQPKFGGIKTPTIPDVNTVREQALNRTLPTKDSTGVGKDGSNNWSATDFLSTGFDATKAIISAIGASKPLPSYQLPDSFTKYKNELETRSKQGLMPNELDNATQRINETYTNDVAAIKNTIGGGGNSGMLLANLGRAATNRNDAFRQLGLADIQQHRQNLSQYGGALGTEIATDQMNFQNEYGQAAASRNAAAQSLVGNLQNIQNRIDYKELQPYYDEYLKSITGATKKYNTAGVSLKQ